MIRRLTQLLFISIVAGCTDSSVPNSTVPVNTGHKDVTKALIRSLENNNIWYSITNETTVEIPNPPPSYLFDYLESEANKIIPKGRSFSVAKDIRKQVYERLTEQNINYHTVIYDNLEFVVWDNKDTTLVNSIINAVAKEALDANITN